MSVEHMAMVFAANGLDGGEKLLLLAYTNYTDPHGYCWPGEERLAADTGTSVSTVRRTKKKLISRNLVRSVRRAETSNLARVNLPLLASMARPRKEYDDNEVERLSFGSPSAQRPESAPDLRTVQSDLSPQNGSDLQTVQSDLDYRSDCAEAQVNLTCRAGQSDLQSISDPSGETTTPSSRPVQLVPELARDLGGGGDASQQQDEDLVLRAAEFVDLLPCGSRLPGPKQRAALIQGVAAAFAGGWTDGRLYKQLTEETGNAKSLASVYRHRLNPENLPAAPTPSAPVPGQRPSLVVDDSAGKRPECDDCGRYIPVGSTTSVCIDCRPDAAYA